SWIGKAKEAVEANKVLFIIFGGLISGVTVVCTFVIGNNWKLKNEIDILKVRQEKDIDALRNEIIAKLEGLRDVNHVYNANWGAILNKDEVVIPKA
ncbi:23612_t:CDS:2, partial [Dentiscutata erythropus]